MFICFKYELQIDYSMTTLLILDIGCPVSGAVPWSHRRRALEWVAVVIKSSSMPLSHTLNHYTASSLTTIQCQSTLFCCLEIQWVLPNNIFWSQTDQGGRSLEVGVPQDRKPHSRASAAAFIFTDILCCWWWQWEGHPLWNIPWC